MLDIRLIRETPDIVRKNLEKRDSAAMIKKLNELIELDKNWRAAKQDAEELKHQRNILSSEIALLKKQGKDISKKLKIAKQIPEKIQELDIIANSLKEKETEILMVLPNILHESVPLGVDDSENKVENVYGKKPRYSFKLKSHVDLLAEKDIADTEKAAEISGARFFYLKKELVMLDYALMKFALDFLYKKGFILIEPPFMIRRKPYEGVTDLESFEDVLYKIENEDLYLIATSEHPIAAYHMNELIDAEKLPLKYAGISPCFRKEAGSHGKDTKGIFRVHQFNKIEQFIFSRAENSWKYHEEMINHAAEIFKKLGFHFRIVNVCTGDIGSIAAKKYDLEVWMPVQQAYREMVSCSNCTDYQARRLNVRYTDGKTRDYVHTLNSTAIATTRALVAIIENFQNKDGSVSIPKILQPYMDGMKKI
ncbi:serine--tRNA ligase [Candidatus Woesearchaeota archaeon]|nr:serine--tRNA ligase [Candidatus Woesearchaeota archaeon]